MTSRPDDSWMVRLTAFFLQCSGFWTTNSRLGKIAMEALTVYTILAVTSANYITWTDAYMSFGNMDVSYESTDRKISSLVNHSENLRIFNQRREI